MERRGTQRGMKPKFNKSVEFKLSVDSIILRVGIGSFIDSASDLNVLEIH